MPVIMRKYGYFGAMWIAILLAVASTACSGSNPAASPAESSPAPATVSSTEAGDRETPVSASTVPGDGIEEIPAEVVGEWEYVDVMSYPTWNADNEHLYAFSVRLPPGWEVDGLRMGADSWGGALQGGGVKLSVAGGPFAVGELYEIAGGGPALIDEEEAQRHVVTEVDINGIPAKLVRPRNEEQGVTGVILDMPSGKILISGRNLSLEQQSTAFAIIRSITLEKSATNPTDSSPAPSAASTSEIADEVVAERIRDLLVLHGMTLNSIVVTSDEHSGQTLEVGLVAPDVEAANLSVPPFMKDLRGLPDEANDNLGTQIRIVEVDIFDEQGKPLLKYLRDVELSKQRSWQSEELTGDWFPRPYFID